MNESITRAAGAVHGQELGPEAIDNLIIAAGRIPLPRTTLYGPVDEERARVARDAQPLKAIAVSRPARHDERIGRIHTHIPIVSVNA